MKLAVLALALAASTPLTLYRPSAPLTRGTARTVRTVVTARAKALEVPMVLQVGTRSVGMGLLKPGPPGSLTALTARGSLGLFDFERDRLAGPRTSAPRASAGQIAVHCGGGLVLCPGSTGNGWYLFRNEPAITNSGIRSASAEFDPQTGAPLVLIRLTPAGRRALGKLTRQVAHSGASRHRNGHIAIVVDGRLVSAPFIDYRFYPQGFMSTTMQVAGLGSHRATLLLAAELAAGPLPVTLTRVR